MNKICYIIGAGIFDRVKFQPKKGDYIIAADGGYNYLKDMGIYPDMLVGDFDSLKEVPNHNNIVKHPPIKDDTDMLLAVKKGLEAGYKQLHIYGGSGSRLDHTIANLQLLSYISKQGARAFMFGNGMEITAITDTKIIFGDTEKGLISVFCHGDKAIGVNLKGLKYPLTNATLTCDYPIGVSNEFMGVESSISVENGTLIIMKGMKEES